MPRAASLDPELAQRLQPELRSGEKLLWAQCPVPGFYARQSTRRFLGGIPFTAFAIFWECMVLSIGKDHRESNTFPSMFMELWGIPFILAGLWMLTSPIWMRTTARRVTYAITSQRAIILRLRITGSVAAESFMPEKLTSMIRNEHPDGSGDLVFEEYAKYQGRSGKQIIRRGFFGVERVREAEDLIATALLAPPDVAR